MDLLTKDLLYHLSVIARFLSPGSSNIAREFNANLLFFLYILSITTFIVPK